MAVANVAIGAMKARLSGSSRAAAAGPGKANRRVSGSPSAGSCSTVTMPLHACCSSHSRAYRASMPARSATAPAVAGPSAKAR